LLGLGAVPFTCTLGAVCGVTVADPELDLEALLSAERIDLK